MEKKRGEKLSILERYLCYRALLLAILGKEGDSEALTMLLRAKNSNEPVLQTGVDK